MERAILVLLFMVISYALGYDDGKLHNVKTVPATYSSKQIDNLIQVDALLASKIKKQLDYEQSISSNH